MRRRRDEFGVSARRWIPLAWRSQPPSARSPERVAWQNQTNEKHLRMLLERETRERPSPEIASLEALIIEVLHCVKHSPTSRSVVLSADSVEWVDTSGRSEIAQGDTGNVRMCLDPELPYEVEFFANVMGVDSQPSGRRVEADLVLRSDAVIDLYEQLVFIYHRRAQRDQRQET